MSAESNDEVSESTHSPTELGVLSEPAGAPREQCSICKCELTAGHKCDYGKAPMGLLPHPALLEIAKVLAFGKRKYSAHNWRSGMAWSRIIDAIYRHIGAFNEGEENDPESNLSHLAHLGCCVLFLLTYQLLGLGTDDRFKPKGKTQ